MVDSVDLMTFTMHTNLLVDTKVPIGCNGGVTRILSNVKCLPERVPECGEWAPPSFD